MPRPSRAEIFRRLQHKWTERNNPLIVKEAARDPAGRYVSMRRLLLLLRCKFSSALQILHEEGITLFVRPTGRVRYEISADELPRLLEKHNTETARLLRRVRAHCTGGEPVSNQCPSCGVVGRQRRVRPAATGLQMAMCTVCSSNYQTGSLRDGVKMICPTCGATDSDLYVWHISSLIEVHCRRCNTYFRLSKPRPSLKELFFSLG